MNQNHDDVFNLSHLNLKPTDHTAGPALIAVMKTEDSASHEYFLLSSTYSNSHVRVLPVTDVSHARVLLKNITDQLVSNADLQISHIVCQGIVMGVMTSNGRLMARNGSPDGVEVDSFDALRAYHLSPVVNENVFEIVHRLIKKNPSECVKAFANAGQLLGMRGWDFENKYAQLMSGLMLPSEGQDANLINACRQATLAITATDHDAQRVLWAQINKVENLIRPIPEPVIMELKSSVVECEQPKFANEVTSRSPRI